MGKKGKRTGSSKDGAAEVPSTAKRGAAGDADASEAVPAKTALEIEEWPEALLGRLIGRRGATIQRLQREAGLQLLYVERNTPTGAPKVVLAGSEEAVCLGERLVRKHLEDCQEEVQKARVAQPGKTLPKSGGAHGISAKAQFSSSSVGPLVPDGKCKSSPGKQHGPASPSSSSSDPEVSHPPLGSLGPRRADPEETTVPGNRDRAREEENVVASSGFTARVRALADRAHGVAQRNPKTCGAVVGGTAVGATGGAVGTVTGGAVGLLAAPLTFGLSVPVGAAIGGTMGTLGGAVSGGTLGAIVGRKVFGDGSDPEGGTTSPNRDE